MIKDLLTEKPSLEDYKTLATLKIIADAKGDVDTFIQLVERSYYDATKINLLLEAYKPDGESSKAQQLLWARFERFLTIGDYLQYLRQCSQQEKGLAKEKALQLARSHNNLRASLQFLADIEQWDEVDAIIVEQAQAKTLDGADYSIYRKLPTALSKQAKYLPATLLRRALVMSVLDSGKSKYYPYALSDLKKAYEFAQQVSDWKGFNDHHTSFANLKKKHFRKHSFWAQIEAKKLS